MQDFFQFNNTFGLDDAVYLYPTAFFFNKSTADAIQATRIIVEIFGDATKNLQNKSFDKYTNFADTSRQYRTNNNELCATNEF